MVASGQTTRYNYLDCFDLSRKHMPSPVRQFREDSHRGPLAATGDYIWRAYSSGEDSELLRELGRESDVTMIPDERTFQALPGSNELYCYTARHNYLPVIEGQFVSCHCSSHRLGCKPNDCPYKDTVYANIEPSATGVRSPEFYLTHWEKPVSNRATRSETRRRATAEQPEEEPRSSRQRTGT